jgi:hypothetical protein
MSKPGIVKTVANNLITHLLRSSAVTWPSAIGICTHLCKVPFELLAILIVILTLSPPFSFPNDATHTAIRPVPWKGVEHLQYKVSWANFVAAGELNLDCEEVSEPGKARVYRLSVRARSVDWVRTLFLNVNDSYEALVEAGTLLPIQAEARLEHGNEREQNSIRFDYQNKVARFSNGQTQPLIPNTYDAATLLFILRTLELSHGKPHTVRLLDKQAVYPLSAESGRNQSALVRRTTQLPS